MNNNSFIRCTAAAALSLLMCMSAGVSASAGEFIDPAVEAGIIDENGNINTSFEYGKARASEASFSIPKSSIKIRQGKCYTIRPTKDSSEAAGISYSSKDTGVASVSKEGKVTGNSAGTTYVVCKAEDGYSISMKVTVVDEQSQAAAQKICFTYQEHSMNVGDVWRASARVAPKGCSYRVSYTSSDTAVATVAKTGEITAVGPGSCTVTITTNNGLTDTMQIIVTDPDSVSEIPESYFIFNCDSLSLTAGEKNRPGISCFPEDSEYDITYSSSDRSVAKVSTTGSILGVAPGTAVITASCGDMSASLEVTVTEAVVSPEEYEYDEYGNLLPSAIEFNVSSDSLMIGEQFTPSVKIYPEEAVCIPAFFSSDPSVASISQNGTITAVGEGSALITAVTNNNKTDSFYVTVYNQRISGIDISKWQGDIDWEKVSQSPDVNFVMIRASYGQEDKDKRLEQNVEGCEEYNIPYGFYHYIYAENVTEAEIEADFFLKTIRGYNPTYPIVLDIEESFYQNMSKTEVTDIVCTFMERLENAGYYAMIYSFAKFYDDCLIESRVNVYDNWVACWGDEKRLSENFGYPYGMWQYSETGKIDGISEYVDLDYCYKNYPFIIKKYHLNNQ